MSSFIISKREYIKAAGLMYGIEETKRDLRVNLWCFFRSVLYQIENEAAHRMAAEWFFTCISKLYENDLHSVKGGWWGEIDEEQLKAA